MSVGLRPHLTVAELPHTPDLVDLVTAARDAGHEVALMERPMPDAISVAGLGRAYDLISTPGGVAIEDAAGRVLDREQGADRPAAAARLWARFAAGSSASGTTGLPATGLVAIGGFAFRPDRDPGDPWAGFPALLLRVPALVVSRVRGRTFISAIAPESEALLDCPPSFRAPAARRLEVEPVMPPEDWKAAVAVAVARLRAGEAGKLVLAREVMARGDGVVSAGAVVRALRAAYPSCFTYLLSGADGTAFAGASPELLVRRMGRVATSQPMAGSVARGADEAEDDRLAALLLASAKDADEHRVTSRFVVETLRPYSSRVVAPPAPEVVRFTNIQHLATLVRADLTEPPAGALELAAALHPTPAVGGWPRAAALGLIDAVEGMERGWYAGTVGWTDARGDGEFAVAIRCGLLWEDGARLYAGNGILPGSDPQTELEETELKLRVLRGALSA